MLHVVRMNGEENKKKKKSMTGNFYMNAAAKQIYGEQRMSNRQRGAINHRGVCVCLSVIPLNASKSPGTTVKSAGKMIERHNRPTTLKQ